MQTTTFPRPIQNDPAYTFGSYIPALHESAKDVVRLTRAEVARACEVLALSADYRHEDDERGTGRFAVCRPIAREQWGQIETGEIIIYTSLYRWAVEMPTATEYAGRIGDYTTNIGPMAHFDAKRNLLYAASWQNCGSNAADGYDGADVCELYVVERFIEVV